MSEEKKVRPDSNSGPSPRRPTSIPSGHTFALMNTAFEVKQDATELAYTSASWLWDLLIVNAKE